MAGMALAMKAGKIAELETARHIHDLARVLAEQATANKFSTLAYILGMAELEAAERMREAAADGPKPRSPA